MADEKEREDEKHQFIELNQSELPEICVNVVNTDKLTSTVLESREFKIRGQSLDECLDTLRKVKRMFENGQP